MAGFEPPAYAVEVEGMVAYAPSNSTLVASCTTLISLAFNTMLHDVVPANSASIHNHIPSPEGDGVPLLGFETLDFLG